MSAKLKTFEDIWKTKVVDRARQYEDMQETNTIPHQFNKKENQKANYQQNNQPYQNNNHTNNGQQKQQQQQQLSSEKPNGLLNERDWEYLDKLGEKFKVLEEKSSNMQKNIKSQVQLKREVDNSQNQKIDDKNIKHPSNKTSPAKNNQYDKKKQSQVKTQDINNNIIISTDYTQMDQNQINIPSLDNQPFNSINIQKQYHSQKQVNLEKQSHIDKQQHFEKQSQFEQQPHFQHEDIPLKMHSQNQENININIQRDGVQMNNYLRIKQQENSEDQYDENTLQLQDKSQYECTFQPRTNQFNQQSKITLNQKNIQRDLSPNHLYEDAIMRKQKQQVIEKLVIKETKKQTNQSKIGANSQKIILKKIEEFLQALIASIEQDDIDQNQNQNQPQSNQQVDQSQRKILKFEGVGYFFQQLGIFRSIKFEENDNGDISISQLRGMNNVEINRMKEEIHFHEELWKIMSIDQQQYKEQEEIESVSSKLLFDIAMVLLELKLTLAQSELLLNEIVLSNLFEDDLDRGQEIIDIFFSLSQNTSLELLVKSFRNLFDDKTQLMDFYANWNKKVTTGISISNYENSEISFHPQINQRSRVIDSQLQQSKSSIQQKRHEILFEHHKVKQERQEIQKFEKQQKEVDQCTFKPQTNLSNNRRQTNQDQRNRNDGNIGEENENEEEQYEIKDQKRYEQLFKIHNRKQNQIKEIKEYVEFYRQEQELEECTFKPQTQEVNREMLNEGHLKNVKGLNQQLSRMYKARKDKLEKQMFFEKQRYTLSVQNSKQGSKVIPFSFEEREKQKKKECVQEQRKLIGHVDVNITKTKKGRVVLHEGDNALELANNFSKIYNISSEMLDTLADMIQQYLDRYTNSSNHQI